MCCSAYSEPAVKGKSEHGPHEEPVVKGISNNYNSINCEHGPHEEPVVKGTLHYTGPGEKCDRKLGIMRCDMR